jgi:hypothetical protein
MATMNYLRTLIAVADDCPVERSVVPVERGGKPTVAVLQYEMIANAPYRHTQEDVLFECWLSRQPKANAASAAHRAKLRQEFFDKPQPCLRSSPLPKKYGWGLLFDSARRVALCPVESAEYRRIIGGRAADVRILKALRSSRA